MGDADPKARIVVATNGPGINFLLQDAKDSRGVEFRVCNNTLTARAISPDKLLMETQIVPSGVAEAAKPGQRGLRLHQALSCLEPGIGVLIGH